MTGKTRNRRSLLRCPGVFCLFWPSILIQFILQTENGGSSTFAGVFDPGRGRIGPALLKVRLVFFLRDASNHVWRFFMRGVFFFFDPPQFLKISVGRYFYPKNSPFFRMKPLYNISETGVATFFFFISNRYSEKRKQKHRWTRLGKMLVGL